MTELVNPDYWLQVLASLTLWGVVGAIGLGARSIAHDMRRERRRRTHS